MNPRSAAIALRRELQRLGTPVTVTWRTTTGGTKSGVTGKVTGGVTTDHSAVLKALVHFAEPKMVARQYAEITVGDCIAEFDADADLDGKRDATFTINGVAYMQKEVGDRLPKVWDATVAGYKTFRTVLLTPKT